MWGWVGEQKHRWRGGPAVTMRGSGGRSGLYLILWGAETEAGQQMPPGLREPQSHTVFCNLSFSSPWGVTAPPCPIFPSGFLLSPSLSRACGLCVDRLQTVGAAWVERCCHFKHSCPSSSFNISPSLDASLALSGEEVRL